MRRLPAASFVLLIAVALGACSFSVEPPSVAPSATATPTPTIPPAVSQEPFPLLSIEWHGGECPSGSCTRYVNVEADGRLHQVIPNDAILGQVPPELIEALQVEMDRANWLQIKGRPFTGTCPTAVDGQELIYTFHATKGDEEIASCKVAIDPNHPLFQAVTAVLAVEGR